MTLPLGSARYSHSVRTRVGLAGFLVCATLASCTRAAPEPHPDRTLEPSITESSPMPTAIPDNPACTLLTKKDRSDLVGYSMNAEVPVSPVKGSVECMWVHSLHESARSAIRVGAIRGEVWAQSLRPQLRFAMFRPSTGKALLKKLKTVWKELGDNGGQLPADEVCPTYVLLAESRGAVPNGDTLFYSTIGSMTAAYAISCEDGNMIFAAYGEHGIGPSIALQNGVLRLLDAAKERSAGIFKEVEAQVDAANDSKTSESPNVARPTDSAAADDGPASDEDASPSPESSPTKIDTSDSDGSGS
jgi:hypothetical protein